MAELTAIEEQLVQAACNVVERMGYATAKLFAGMLGVERGEAEQLHEYLIDAGRIEHPDAGHPDVAIVCGTKAMLPAKDGDMGYVSVADPPEEGVIVLFERPNWARVIEVDLEHELLIVTMNGRVTRTRTFAQWNDKPAWGPAVQDVLKGCPADYEPTGSDWSTHIGLAHLLFDDPPPAGRVYHLGGDEGNVRFNGFRPARMVDGHLCGPWVDADYDDEGTPVANAETEESFTLHEWNATFSDRYGVTFTDPEPTVPATASPSVDSHLPIPRPCDVDISLIDVVSNVRTLFDDDSLALIGESVADQGQIETVKLMRKPDGRYRLLDGERRFRGAKAKGLASLRAEVYDVELSEEQILRLQLTTFTQKRELSHAEKSAALAQYQEASGKNTSEIARSLGMSEDDVRKHLKLRECAPEVQAMVCGTDDRKRTLSLNKAVTIGRLPIGDQVAMAERCWLQGWTEAQLTDQVNAALAGDDAGGGGLLHEAPAETGPGELPDDDELERRMRTSLRQTSGGSSAHDQPNPDRQRRVPAASQSTVDARHEQAKKDAEAADARRRSDGGSSGAPPQAAPATEPATPSGRTRTVKNVKVSFAGEMKIDREGNAFLSGPVTLSVANGTPTVQVTTLTEYLVNGPLGKLVGMAPAPASRKSAPKSAAKKVAKKQLPKKKAAKKKAAKK